MHMHRPLEVFQLSTLAELASLRLRWNELAAGVPTRTWEWMESWWRIYGNGGKRHPVRPSHAEQPRQEKELYLLAAFEAPDRLVAIAPWYIEHTANYGRILRFLGSGEVCTDYSTVLCEPGYEQPVAEALAKSLSDPLHVADWLTQNSVRHWDRIEFDAVSRNDAFMQSLFTELERHNNLVHRREAENCWQLSLPATWDEYLAQLSKSHRKQVRRCQREFLDSGRAKMNWVEHEGQFDIGWNLLVRLHQRRQKSLGNQGCFASPSFGEFQREIARQLFRAGRLWLSYLEVDGKPTAAEYQLIGDDTVYAYQGGIEPAALELSPGQISLVASLRRAIEEGYQHYDFLRGDEPYKAHWRATPTATEDIRVVKSTAANRMRHGLWVAGDHVRNWLKTGFVQSAVPIRS